MHGVFATRSLAADIDRAESRLTASIGRTLCNRNPNAFVEELGGGIAAFTGPGSPMNKMIGVGFDDLPSDECLSSVERKFAERGAPLQAEVSTLADPAFAARLTRRGYILQGFENVLGRTLGEADAVPPSDGRIDISMAKDDEIGGWLDATVTGFATPDLQGVQSEPPPDTSELRQILEDFTSVPGFQRYFARVEGQIAGTATLRLDGALAQLCGATTLPMFRRRGVQTALLRRRLADAVDAGCRLALLTTNPGSKSQENGHRQGFALLYSRALLVKGT